ncbi:MAG: hypothetical protein JST40_04945 [Armatimonadetes bacterium]|nr:hypothetical protein [Armatimonadota bacterium]
MKVDIEYLFGPPNQHDDDVADHLLEEGRLDWIHWALDTMINWAEVCRGMGADRANTALWRIIGFPLFVPIASVNNEDQSFFPRLLAGAEAITLSIPKLHPAGERMGNAYFMLWDVIAKQAQQDEQQNAVSEILAYLVVHPDRRVRHSALHGLGHLPENHRLGPIGKFLNAFPEDASDPWVQSCLDGTVM